MRLYKQLLENNNCYKRGKRIQVRGIMWHSTGVNNPNLCRYVQPDDGILGKNRYNNHWNNARPEGRNVCVHAFIGKDKNGQIATYQTLPWDYKGWHCGGEANNTYIGFEICEDNLADTDYFASVYQEACELTAYLCNLYKLDPLQKNIIICHQEGARMGIASNHADVLHWFSRHNKTMDDVRKDVYNLMHKQTNTEKELTPIEGLSQIRINQMKNYIKHKNPNVDKHVLNYIPLYVSLGATENIRGDVAFAQACLETGNFTFNGSAVTLDQNNFCGMGVLKRGQKGNSFSTPRDGILAQIQHLKAYASNAPLVLNCIDPRFKYVKRACAPYVEWLGQKENPSGAGWASGAQYGPKILKILQAMQNEQVIYDDDTQECPFKVRVDLSSLRIRFGPGTEFLWTGKHTGAGVFTIVEVKGNWGKLKSGAGWIHLAYTTKCY